MLLVAFALIAGWNIQRSPVEYLPDGAIDNGPELGACAIIILSPVVYVVLLAVHVILMYVDRMLKLSPLPFWTIVILAAMCALTTWGIHNEPTGSHFWREAVFAFVLSFLLFIPMAVSSVILNRRLKPIEI